MNETSLPSDKHFREQPTALIVADAWLPAGAAGLIAALSGYFGYPLLCLLFGVCALFLLSFFRNPTRVISGSDTDVVSPADGRVIEVKEEQGRDGNRQLRIGIFLSVFNVHVNRSPLSGRVVSIERTGTLKRAAFDPRAVTDNVQCSMTLEADNGVVFQVVQITGLIARRIVCRAVVGDWIERGQRYGLIRFGSRTDVVLPIEAKPMVSRGQRVRGGVTILAELFASPRL